MEADLTGGLNPSLEPFIAAAPENPDMRDSASLWVMDDAGVVAFPRVTLDAIGAHWDSPWAQLNVVLADGRTLRVWDQLPGAVGPGPAGEAVKRSAGPLVFECVEPFTAWIMSFDGPAQLSTTGAQCAGLAGGSPVPLAFHIEARMTSAPWLMGGLTAEAANAMSSQGGAFMGGLRYEQLCRVSGWVRVGGDTNQISGTGMRVRRRGVRNMAGAPGHCQHSALFPSGRAFGANAFWPAPDGSQSFNEAFVITGAGERLAGKLVRAPWMTRLTERSDDLSLVIETARGSVRIEGRSLMKTFDHHHFEMADTSVLEQGAARYVWDGEETIGLFERCTLRTRLATGLGAVP